MERVIGPSSSRVARPGSAGTENVDAKCHLASCASASVQQRARILVLAITQGLTRRPAARDAGVLHGQGAPVAASGSLDGTALNTTQPAAAEAGGGSARRATMVVDAGT
ncbi:hypothetical protein OPT61_g9911 [Boeremia exigua]|uniref:Uncharacterized protein n=1 Tax=Boeremia exigua TaxID=749465 RepID=A0ACC2HS30_9PLEO|nr:hypothetical protein OPT61_g9911 [Boeremia exigua]